MQSLADFMHVRRYSKRTVDTYLYWIRFYIRFHGLRHPKELEPEAVERFLTHLAVERTVAASTQALALNAIASLYNTFLQQPIGDIGAFRRSTRQAKLPIVLTVDEVRRLLATMTATSFDRTAAAIGRRAWRVLHLAGGYYLLFQFTVSFGKRIPDMPLYALFLIPLIAVFALRMIWRRARNPRRGRNDVLIPEQVVLPSEPTVH